MNDLFVALLVNAINHGKLKGVCLYENHGFASIEVENESGKYKISITKQEEKENG